MHNKTVQVITELIFNFLKSQVLTPIVTILSFYFIIDPYYKRKRSRIFQITSNIESL